MPRKKLGPFDRNKKKFSGVLVKPIEVHDQFHAHFLTPEESRAVSDSEISEQARERMMALFDHYEIPRLPNGNLNWMQLARSLVWELPAFKIVHHRARKKPRSRRNEVTLMQLLADVESRQERNKSLSDKAAIGWLVAHSPRWKGKNPRTLQNDLIAARDPTQNSHIQIMQLIRKNHPNLDYKMVWKNMLRSFTERY